MDKEDDIQFEFHFHFGKKKRSFFDYVKLGILLNGAIDVISLVPFLSKKNVFNFIDSVQLQRNHDFLNDYIISDPKLLGYRIDRQLDKAFKEYKKNNNEN